MEKSKSLNSKLYDIAVIGAGPAGTAAAIFAALKGLHVILIESSAQPKARPGESLPPGVEPIFKQLGVWNSILKLNPIRNFGHYTWNNFDVNKLFHPFGNDDKKKWQGIQIPRNKLDLILQNQAETLGVTFIRDCHIKNIFQINARFYIDATGSNRLISRNLGIKHQIYSPTFIAQYGYLKKCAYQELPLFIQEKHKWSWYAKIQSNHFAWVCVDLKKSSGKMLYTASGGADVTWQMATRLAGPHFFLVGDAACILDPCASHGVLRAVMTGMMATHTINRIIHKEISPEFAYQSYQRWLTHWFINDARELMMRHRF